MPLFGFGDIQFKKSSSGPLQSLVENKFTTSTLRYPLDIGNADKGHYMLFYIKKQAISTASDESTPTSFTDAASAALKNPISGAITDVLNSARNSVKTNVGGELASIIQNSFGQINNATGGVIGNLTSSVGSAFNSFKGTVGNFNNPFGQPNIFNVGGSSSQVINRDNIKSLVNSGDIVRGIKKTTRTGQVIALYMPDTLQFDYQQDYENLSVAATAAGIAAATTAGTIGKEENSFTAAIKSIPAIIQSEANKRLGAVGALGGFLTTGAVVNPLLEVLYRAPQFRSFQYDFLFYPRDEREAVEVQKIISALQYHQAPEFKEGSSGSLLIPPSEFDIEFYYGGKINKNIPKTGNCVLKSIQVNYAPNGFSAYEVPGQNATLGGTGMPVSIQMSLQFQETNYLTKNTPGNPSPTNGNAPEPAAPGSPDAIMQGTPTPGNLGPFG
jgi:hypothetical protein